jgi:hypothetical protein
VKRQSSTGRIIVTGQSQSPVNVKEARDRVQTDIRPVTGPSAVGGVLNDTSPNRIIVKISGEIPSFFFRKVYGFR